MQGKALAQGIKLSEAQIQKIASEISVIKRGPKWKPAVQNGRNVIYRHKQSITFMVSEE